MSVQPPRFAVRSLIIRDISISPGARILYIYLDDATQDHWKLYEKQLRLAVTMGITTRQLRTQLGELREAGYIAIRQTMNGNVYELERKKTSDPDGKKTSARSGRKLPILPCVQETTSTEGALCFQCNGKGLITRVIRGAGANSRCDACDGSGQYRRSA